ncbi:MAG: DUF3179 domain-containing protein [Gemmatimonadetes bacterium]|nr:DUF3179 domain-containing protein [Gemmatimonadota bacterium]NIQ52901.1 DUF3179 domain-containing protein [Gemmatimonadota bacterium]NIU73033.1 DUF3179 domain-containing protein [Gammaproteobacteria bacterium]NIX43370.1 DUF3179 domain-containing protein [Gemmatimonadota bacterium]NIY07545.1 DUF3179 domain-containing protein [Gemmatimonadota bacterium]
MRSGPVMVLAGGLGFAAPLAGQDGEWKTDFSRHTVPLEEIVPGGPPKDGIPALDDPVFVPIARADRWLEDREPVIVVEHDGDVRAYPYQILIWHEIVNDVVGGMPVVVTYCPLCNTALAFERRLGDRVLDFGTTGRLRHSDLVMYDRQTESWWQQATGEAIVGALAGRRLAFIPAQTVRWADFKRAHPDGRVLSRETGYDRPYGRNPYSGYDRGRGPIASFFSRDVDDRLPAMERVAAISLDDRSLAFPFSELRIHRVVNDRVAGRPLVVFWAPGTASALDAASVAGGRDVGTSGVFSRTIDGRTLTFEAEAAGRFRDRETGSSWDIRGRAIAGPLEGDRLAPIPHGDYFWFAWAAFRPGTEVRRP